MADIVGRRWLVSDAHVTAGPGEEGEAAAERGVKPRSAVAVATGEGLIGWGRGVGLLG